jgi:hypothetical protein
MYRNKNKSTIIEGEYRYSKKERQTHAWGFKSEKLGKSGRRNLA